MCSLKLLSIASALNLMFQTSLSTRKNQPINPLANQHLQVLWTRYGGEYNKSYVGPKKGGLMMEYLADRFRFSYSYLRVEEVYFFPVGQSKGLVNYLVDGECDILAHDILMTPEIYKLMETTLPWTFNAIRFVVPVPDHTANFDAIVKPFHWLVWLLTIISILVVIFILKLISRKITLANTLTQRETSRESRHYLNGGIQRRQNITWNIYHYVFGMLLAQGGPCVWRNPSTRILAGVWCLATFVLVQAYTSTLFTYIVTPTISPLLVNSVYDLVNKPEINMVVEIGRNFENAIKNTKDKTGVFKQLRDKLEAFPKSRCYNGPECVELVKKGGNVVLVQAHAYALDYMIADFKTTGKCNLQLAKESFWPFRVSWGLPKKNVITEVINKGILEMCENGLMDHWETWFRSIPEQCLEYFENKVKRTKEVKTGRISLRNLTSAFIILLIGYFLSILAFVGEYVIHFARNPH